MFEEYKNGRTPNPDILCNREIKFDLFLDIAIKLGADYIATGHYAQVTESKKNNKSLFHLKSGKDKSKDQSYFLCQLNQFQLSKTIFPIGKINKKDVRKIAKKNNLITADKKDSQGLCFIGKVKLPDFLQQSLKPKNGNVVLIDKYFNGYKLYSNTKEINISIQVFKNKKTTAKNTSGKILEYRIELKANILVKDFISNEILLEHTFDSFSSYKVQDQHSETIKLENKTTEDLVNKVFDDLLIKLTENII